MPAKIIEGYCYMIINSRGRVRATKNKPDLQYDEVAVRLAFTLPEIGYSIVYVEPSGKFTVDHDGVESPAVRLCPVVEA